MRIEQSNKLAVNKKKCDCNKPTLFYCCAHKKEEHKHNECKECYIMYGISNSKVQTRM